MKRVLLLFILTIALWGGFLWPEATYSGFNNNDMNGHESLTRAVIADWQHGGWGLDAWHDRCCLGSPPFRTYQPLGHLVAAGISVGFGVDRPGLVLHALAAFALLAGCLAFFFAARLIGASPLSAWAAAALHLTISAFLPLGHNLHSYTFIEEGLFTQALAMPFFVLGLALTLRLVDKTRSWRRDAIALAVCFSLTFGFQHLYGYLLALVIAAVGAWGLARRSVPLPRFALIAALVTVIFLILNGFQLWSLWADAALSRPGELDPAARWNGWGWRWVWRVFSRGELWDYQRWPVFSLLVLIGALSGFRRQAPPALRILPWLLLGGLAILIGRTGLGNALDWIPGMRQFPMERATGLIDTTAILLAGAGAGALLEWRSRRRWWQLAARAAAVVAIAYPSWDRLAYLHRNAIGLDAQQQAMQRWDPRLFSSIKKETDAGYLRTYADGEKFEKLGLVSYHCIASQLDVPQLTNAFYNGPYVSESTRHFRQEDPEYYRFFNVTAAMLPDRITPPAFLEKVYDSGTQSSFRVPTAGPLAVVAVPRVTVVPGSDYIARLGHVFFTDGFRADGEYSSLVPEPIARHWPQALPRPTETSRPAAGWGSVLSWERPQSGIYHATLRADAAGTYGMLRQSYHPRWEIVVNGHQVTPLWGTPGFLLFPLTPGRNEVEIRFPADPVRNALFLLAMAGYASLVLVSAARQSRRINMWLRNLDWWPGAAQSFTSSS